MVHDHPCYWIILCLVRSGLAAALMVALHRLSAYVGDLPRHRWYTVRSAQQHANKKIKVEIKIGSNGPPCDPLYLVDELCAVLIHIWLVRFYLGPMCLCIETRVIC